jgi:hypothetical protein
LNRGDIVNTEEKDVMRKQIVRIMFATPMCPDGDHGRPCNYCMAGEVADAVERLVDADRLAR